MPFWYTIFKHLPTMGGGHVTPPPPPHPVENYWLRHCLWWCTWCTPQDNGWHGHAWNNSGTHSMYEPGGGGGGGHVSLGPVQPRKSLSEKHPKQGWSDDTHTSLKGSTLNALRAGWRKRYPFYAFLFTWMMYRPQWDIPPPPPPPGGMNTALNTSKQHLLN